MPQPPYPFRRFVVIDDTIEVSDVLTSVADDPGFPPLVEAAAGSDWEPALRRGRYGFLVGEDTPEVVYADDQALRAWAATQGLELLFPGG